MTFSHSSTATCMTTPGQVRAEAAVRAAGEAEVVVGLAVDDELVGALVDRAGRGWRRRPARRPCRPCLSGQPWNSASRVDLAPVAEDDRVAGAAHSSTADGISSGSAISRRRSSGCSARCRNR